MAARKLGEASTVVERLLAARAAPVALIAGGLWLSAICAAAIIPALAGLALAFVGFVAGVIMISRGFRLIRERESREQTIMRQARRQPRR